MPPDPAERLALGLVHVEHTRLVKVVGAEALEIDGLVLSFTNQPEPSLNSVVVAREPEDAPRALAKAGEAFALRGLPLGIGLQVGRHLSVERAVRGAGLRRIMERPGMVAPLDALRDAAPPPQVQILEVRDEAGADALVRVDVEAFGGDPRVAKAVHGAGAFGVPTKRSFVAWHDGAAAGAASAFMHEGAVGIMGVGVVEAARRRGVGAAVTTAAARAFPQADLAWLQPSDMALGMYRSLGFVEVSRWEVWAE
jgi:ribosomal protein S18 acetylase RimI-like enzyme